MKPTMLDLTRVWAALTGIALVVCYFVELALGITPPPVLSMLVVAIGGFELFLYSQDLWLNRGKRHG